MKKMYKVFSCLLCTMAAPSALFAQVTDTSSWWTCMKGNTADQEYTTVAAQGTANGTNRPGGRGGCATWVAKDNTLWSYGGNGYYTGYRGPLNDLWKYDPATNQWTWVHGNANASDVPPTYGTQGTPNNANTPGGRESPAYWTDTAGNFWLYGGAYSPVYGTPAYYGDLWCYKPGTNQWTWVNGPNTTGQAPVAPSKGVAATTNNPGALSSPIFWRDADNNFWLYGGWNGSASYNRLWKYDPAANTWTWVSGDNTTNANGVYGTAGTPGGQPGARNNGTGWADLSGNFWIFGGGGRDATSSSDVILGDLWRYSPSANQWTWMKGPKTGGSAAVYGTRGVGAATNDPGSRAGVRSWVDIYGNGWIYSGISSAGTYGDAWKYDAVADQWIWMKGTDLLNQKPVFGTLTLPGANNRPGGSGSDVVWTDRTGNFWTFGGWGWNTNGQYNLNTIWRLAPAPTSPPAQPGTYTAAKPVVCQGEANVTYTVPAVSAATSYEWTYTGNGATFSGGTSTSAPTNNVSFSTSATNGTLRVRAVNGAGSSAYRDTAITVNTAPSVSLTPTGSQLVCTGDSLLLSATSSGVTYQWKNGTTNVGTGASTYYAKTAGTYTVVVTSTTTNCPATSASATLSLKTLPSVTVTPTGNQPVCTGDSLLLSATSSGVTYQWKNGTANVGTGASSYYAKDAGDYTVTVTSTSTNCFVTSAPVTVTLTPLPSVTVTPTGAQYICQGDSLLLSATSGGVTYEWRDGTTPVGTSASYYAKTAGNYTVTVKSTSTNCTATSTPATVLNVRPTPVAAVTPSGQALLCHGDSVTLTAATGANYSYKWLNGAAQAGTNVNTYTAHATGSYRVVVTDDLTGCADSSAPVSVKIHDRPVVSLVPADTSFCEGRSAVLTVMTQDTGLTYRWHNSASVVPLASAYFLEVDETGAYTVVVGRALVAHCEDTTNTVTVRVHPLPAVTVTWDGQLFHATPGYPAYQWSTDGQPIAGATDTTFMPVSDGGYVVTVTDSNGCSATSVVSNVHYLGVGGKMMPGGQVRIYPNPASSVVYIEAPVPVRVRMISLEGKTVAVVANVKEVSLDGIPPGMYFLEVADENGRLLRTEKLVKARQ